jgi:hypothetical protein
MIVEEPMQAIADRMVTLLDRLEPEGNLDTKIERLVEGELQRRLMRYELTERHLSRRYSCSFAEFKENRIVAREGYTFEVESDFWDWEMALDGIATVQEMLGALRETTDDRGIKIAERNP